MNNEDKKKRVRILLRVSSDQQLEADGDLNVQRQLVLDYVHNHEDWLLDKKEYFEGSNSGYKNSVKDREILQEAYRDAENHEYDILVAYKDDRIGRRMWEIGSYIMSLKDLGVDVYTVKDGCISPDDNDMMGQMMLALRYGNAQKSSSDTGMRVKDTAQKLVRQGKFMGGKAPYGYKLEMSGIISKHGRALKHLVIVPEHAEVVKHIYSLSFDKEYGSSKIASLLNNDKKYKDLAPNGIWKGGSITSILTNPIYAGYTAYKRRERVNRKNQYHKLKREDWIVADKQNPDIAIIDEDMWNRVQTKREQRSKKYIKSLEEKKINVIKRNDGMLSLIDVLYCEYCGYKMSNGSKYNYWTIKSTGEKRASKIPTYRCQGAQQGIPHPKSTQYRADKYEPIVFEALAEYIGVLMKEEDIYEQITTNNNKAKKDIEMRLTTEKNILKKIQQGIETLYKEMPKVINGEHEFSLKDFSKSLKSNQEDEKKQSELVQHLEQELENLTVLEKDWSDTLSAIPTWQDIFMNADTATKRVLVDRLIERINIGDNELFVRFKINLNYFFSQPRINNGFGVPKQGL